MNKKAIGKKEYAADSCDDAWKNYFDRVREGILKYRLYRSFTSGKTYKLFTTDIERNKKLETASGLLQDIAALTNSLNTQQVSYKKEITEEAFAAYLGFYCAVKIMSMSAKYGVSPAEGADIHTDIWSEVYADILTRVKKYLNTKEEDKRLKCIRGQIQTMAYYGSIDRYNKLYPKLSAHDCKEGNSEKRVNYISMETSDKETDDDFLSPEIAAHLCEQVEDMIKLDQAKEKCLEVLEICKFKEEITKDEYDIVTLHFGLCDGPLDPLELKEISEEIGKSYSYVQKHYNRAIEQIGRRFKSL